MRHPAAASRVGALGLAGLLVGCRTARTAPTVAPTAGSAQLLSSEGSEYAPVLRAAVRVRLDPDSVVIAVDSGSALAPGQPVGGAPPVMTALRLTAVVAGPRPPGAPPAGTNATLAGGTSWITLAEGPPVPVADTLFVGVRHPLTPVRLAVARPAGLGPRQAFLVFRVTGVGLEIRGRAPDGGFLVSRSARLPVSVYACSPRALDGAPDAGRDSALAANYTAAC